MKKLGLIIFAVFILFSVGSYARYKNVDIKPTPIPTPSSVPSPTLSPTLTITPTPQKQPDAIITPGESARVQCGTGNAGTRVTFNEGGFAGNIGLGDQTDITAKVSDDKGQAAGGLVEWKLYYYGKLRVDGCSATFIAPSGIGTARQVSATVTTRVVSNNPTPTSASFGEGGPINAGFVATTKINILSSGGGSSCYNPAGVAISVNSPSTFDNVQIVVDTPKFLGRQYNSRVATVRDGVGTYNIEVYLNGNLYGSTSTYVDTCEMATVKY